MQHGLSAAIQEGAEKFEKVCQYSLPIINIVFNTLYTRLKWPCKKARRIAPPGFR